MGDSKKNRDRTGTTAEDETLKGYLRRNNDTRRSHVFLLTP